MPLHYLLAFLLGVAGLALIGCGSFVCWRRFGRCRRGPDDKSG